MNFEIAAGTMAFDCVLCGHFTAYTYWLELWGIQ